MEYMWLILFAISIVSVVYGMFMNIKAGKSMDKQAEAAKNFIELAQISDPKDWSSFLKLTKESAEIGVFDETNKEALDILLKLEKSPGNPITKEIIRKTLGVK